MLRTRLSARARRPSLLLLVAGYVGFQLMLRAVEVFRPRLAVFTLVTSLALLLALIVAVAYLRADRAVAAGVILGLAESVAHLSTDIAAQLLAGNASVAVIEVLSDSLLEFAIRWSALSLALTALVWSLRRVRPGNSSRDEARRSAA